MQTNRTVVFDASIFIYANFFVMSSYMGKEPTAQQLANKIQQQISSIISKHFKGYTILIAFDSKNNFRKTIYDGYKASRITRNIDKEYIYQHLTMYFNTLRLDGLEADDIGYLVATHREGEVILVSEDADWRLMLNERTLLYRYKQNKFITLDSMSVIIEQVMKVAGGCTGDEVPSIKLKRFGEKTLNKAIEAAPYDLTTLDEILNFLHEQCWISDFAVNKSLVVYDQSVMEQHVRTEDIELLINEIKDYD